MSHNQLLFALISFSVVSACADPKCPPPYMKFGNVCRLCPPGEDKEQGKCVPIRDAAAEAVVEDTDAGEDARSDSGEYLGDAMSVVDGRDADAPPGPDGDASQATDANADAGQTSDAAPEPDAGDVCSPSLCQNGGRCSEPGQPSPCDCARTGHTGATCEIDVDECASANSCSDPAYPCVQTEAPGYTCQGQFADWPMPDAVVGSKVKPDYDTTSVANVVIDRVTGLAWQKTPPLETRSWEEAKTYCQNFVLGEWSDWRLPTKIELESIVDDTKTSPSINEDAFPDTVVAGVYLTASQVAGFPQGFPWLVEFNRGLTWPSTVSGVVGNVRCVQTARRPASSPSERYAFGTIADLATVADARTGLVWERDLYSAKVDRSGARERCASLGGRWRVPTKKELLTLVDPTIDSATPPVLDLNAFPGTPAEATFWSISVDFGTAAGWVLGVNGAPAPSSDEQLHYVRCVH